MRYGDSVAIGLAVVFQDPRVYLREFIFGNAPFISLSLSLFLSLSLSLFPLLFLLFRTRARDKGVI